MTIDSGSERLASLENLSEELAHRMRLFEQAPGFACFFRAARHVDELQKEAHARLAGHKGIIGASTPAFPFTLLPEPFTIEQLQRAVEKA